MNELLAYSGVVTKIKALEGRLFTEAEYRELAGKLTVSEAVNYLKNHRGYRDAFSGKDSTDLHRGQIEDILDQMTLMDFQKIYRFCSVDQRKFLVLYFRKYEIMVLKRCLRMIFDHREIQVDLSGFRDFFDQHSRMELADLEACRDMDMLLDAVKGTIYEKCLRRVRENPDAGIHDYATALDYDYFLYLWKEKDKYLKGRELELITEIYGVKMELLTLDWLARGKKYYHMQPHELYSICLPCGVHLSKNMVYRLADAETMEEFERLLSETYYARHYPGFDIEHLEALYGAIRAKLHKRLCREHPYSMASIVAYLFNKEREIDLLTSILECIRYSLDAESILRIG